MGNFVCYQCGLHTNHSRIRWLQHLKGTHEGPYTQLLNEQRERWRVANLLNRAVAAIDDRDEVRRMSRRQKRHRLLRDLSPTSQMGGDRNGKNYRNVFSTPFPRSLCFHASGSQLMSERIEISDQTSAWTIHIDVRDRREGPRGSRREHIRERL